MMERAEMYTHEGAFAVYRLDRNHDGAMWICSRSTTCEGQTVHRVSATTCTTRTSTEAGHRLCDDEDGQRDLRRDAPD